MAHVKAVSQAHSSLYNLVLLALCLLSFAG